MANTSSLRDPNTLSNYDKFRTRHITANLNIDFSKKRLNGNVHLSLETLQPSDEIVLDTSHLHLTEVKVDGSPTKWSLGSRTEPYGSALKVHISKEITVGKHVNLAVHRIIAAVRKPLTSLAD